MARKSNTTSAPEPQPEPEVQPTPEPQPETAKAKTPPPSLDTMAESPLCAPLVARIRELQEADAAAAAESTGDGDLATAREKAHATMTTAANEAIKAIEAYRDGIDAAENGNAQALTGAVSRWSQKKDGQRSALDNFARASATYAKARKAHRDSQSGTSKTPNGKEIASLTAACRKVYAAVSA